MRVGLFGAVMGLAMLAAGSAAATNVCNAGKLMCATTMPVGGFCTCMAKGQSADGTVVAHAPSGAKLNATAGGCGAHPNAPGCR